MTDNRLNVGVLTQGNGVFVLVPCHLDPEQPVELAQVSDLNMLSDITLELIYFSQSHGSDCAIVNVDNDNNELTGLPMPEVNSLIDRALGKAQFINKDLHQPLVPAALSRTKRVGYCGHGES